MRRVFSSLLHITRFFKRSRHLASLMALFNSRLVRSTVFNAWMWMEYWQKHQQIRLERMRHHAALLVCRAMWRSWTSTCKRLQLHAHTHCKVEAMLQRRAVTLLRAAFFQLWLHIQHLRAPRQIAVLQAKALAWPLCQWVWQRWWWVRWRRRRHSIGMQSMYFWVVKRENDRLRAGLKVMAEHARSWCHRRNLAHAMNSAKREDLFLILSPLLLACI